MGKGIHMFIYKKSMEASNSTLMYIINNNWLLGQSAILPKEGWKGVVLCKFTNEQLNWVQFRQSC